MNPTVKRISYIVIVVALAASLFTSVSNQLKGPTATPTLGGSTPSKGGTATPTRPSGLTPTSTASPAPGVTVTVPVVTETRIPPNTNTQPYQSAPLCENGLATDEGHDRSEWHGLWDFTRGCHYDHEHGSDPALAQGSFPGFDFVELQCGNEIGHCNPSSPMENTHKHGGMKTQSQPSAPLGCTLGFEGATVAVDADIIQYHNLGDYSIEMDARIHSLSVLLRQCKSGNPSDKGYVYIVQHVDYGQRVAGYQGDIIPFPDTPNPAYADGLAPYFSIDCIGRPAPVCDGTITTREAKIAANQNASSTWTSKSSFRLTNPPSGSPLVAALFRVRDLYQILDWSDTTHPFKFVFMCSSDGGVTYDGAMANCRWNNSTSFVHEITGVIPTSWDNLVGFDTDPRSGRITADGFVTKFGQLRSSCTEPVIPSLNDPQGCFPIRLLNAFTGQYGSQFIFDKRDQFRPAGLPERDICFANNVHVQCDTPGAQPSGWIGVGN